ncbi:30S ribosomal protein S21 [bacterium]|nr:30S ribosomal protein S21 [bacterium]
MIKIDLQKEKNLESALKKLKFKFEKIGIKKELLSRKEFIKPSVERRSEIKKAIYRQSLNRNKDS